MKRNKPVKPHKNAPKKLVRLWRKLECNYYKTGKELGVAPSWVWQLIKEGIEPKRLDLRRKLFLTRKKSAEELEKQREERLRKKARVDSEIVEHLQDVMRRINAK